MMVSMSNLLATLLAASVGAVSPEVSMGYSISISSNNGSLPPPHHRATEIQIDGDGHGHYTRRLGYDLADARQRFERDFQISADQQISLSKLIDELNVLETPWREIERPNVGGSSTTIRCGNGTHSVVIPSQLIADQREARDRLVTATQALIPKSVLADLAEWSRTRPDLE